jgi:N-acetylmuramoyl-L-alanine amidase
MLIKSKGQKQPNRVYFGKLQVQIRDFLLVKVSKLPKNNRPSGLRLAALAALLLVYTNAAFAYTVVIDAGHGGHDSGCLGVTKVKEKDVALSIALKLGALIEEQLPEVSVVYTRKTDVFLELHERAEVANSAKADLFICIHCNSACRFDKAKRKEVCNPVIQGAETYVMGLHKTEANLEVAKRENNVILLEKDYTTHYEGFDPNSSEANIIFSLYQNTFMEQSLNFASMVQEQLGVKGRSSRGVKPAGFWVLFKTTMPSVLIETGFLSHPEEERFLASTDGQQTMASGIFRAFRQYRKESGKPSEQGVTTELKQPSPDQEKSRQDGEKGQEDPKEKTTSATVNTVWYSVQLMSSDKQIPADAPRFRHVGEVREDRINGIYKYCHGRTASFQEAVVLQGKMRSSGFKDAFVVAYRDDSRITVQEARQSQSKDNPK